MALCQKRSSKCFGLVIWPKKHLFLVTNVFCTLQNPDIFDVIKTCQYCSSKEALSMDKQTLIETATLFPAAFEPLVREYIQSWSH